MFHLCNIIKKNRRIYYGGKAWFIFIYHDWYRKFIIYHLRFSFPLHCYRNILLKSKHKPEKYICWFYKEEISRNSQFRTERPLYWIVRDLQPRSLLKIFIQPMMYPWYIILYTHLIFIDNEVLSSVNYNHMFPNSYIKGYMYIMLKSEYW